MEGIRGRAIRIDRPVVGRIDSVKNDETGFSCLVAGEEPVFIRIGSPKVGLFVHPSLHIQSPVGLSEGDIVSISPEGTLRRLYDQHSTDNSILLTERCNSHCRMCPQPPQSDSGSRLKEAIRIVDLADPSPVALGITGGEPTLVFDDLLELLSACRERHPETHIQLLTNGRAFREFAKAKAVHEAAGGRLTVCIPLYGDVPEVHDDLVGIKGAFWEAVEGMHNLGRLGTALEVRNVVLRQNHARLRQWAEFIYRNFPFAAHVAIMGLEPIGLGRANLEEIRIDPADYTLDLEAAIRFLHRAAVPVSVFNHQLCTLPRRLWRFAARSISGWKVRYAPECSECAVQGDCGGFFFSALDFRSKLIAPMR